MFSLMATVQTGDCLTLKPANYRLFPGIALDDFEQWAPLAEYHGGVAYEVDNEGEQSQVAVISLSQGSWWVLRYQHHAFGVHASKRTFEDTSAGPCYVLLTSSSDVLGTYAHGSPSWDSAPELWITNSLRRKGDAWVTDNAHLAIHPRLTRTLRDWLWPFENNRTISMGFSVYLSNNSFDLQEWLHRNGPIPYNPCKSGGENRSSQRVSSSLTLTERTISFWRDWSDVPYGQSELDSALLWSLADEAPIDEWQLVDGDYGTTLALGDDAVSLREFLNPFSQKQALLTKYQRLLEPTQIDVSEVTTIGGFVTSVLRALGAPQNTIYSLADAERWLKNTPRNVLPKRIVVTGCKKLREACGVEWWFSMLQRTKPTLRCTLVG